LKDHDIGFALKEFTNPATDKKEFGKSEIVAVHADGEQSCDGSIRQI